MSGTSFEVLVNVVVTVIVGAVPPLIVVVVVVEAFGVTVVVTRFEPESRAVLVKMHAVGMVSGETW